MSLLDIVIRKIGLNFMITISYSKMMVYIIFEYEVLMELMPKLVNEML
jgi:hypothetical protein